jgi:hypothetical protein
VWWVWGRRFQWFDHMLWMESERKLKCEMFMNRSEDDILIHGHTKDNIMVWELYTYAVDEDY